MTTKISLAEDVVNYWRLAGKEDNWFSHRPEFDSAFRERFLALHEQAAAGDCDHWISTPTGALALMILLDQFPRNAFRGTRRMYATDPKARALAREAHAHGHMPQVEAGLRPFFALPFSHSEDVADQDFAVELNRGFGQPWLGHAEGHRDVVRRFGRFPHRNPILGRETTPDEAEYLENGGFKG